MKLKKLTAGLLALALAGSLAACGGNNDEQTGGASGEQGEQQERVEVKVGIVGESYETIWAPVIADLAEEGIDVKLVNFGEYSLPNPALNDGEIDLNAFQHNAYLRDEIETAGYDIAPIGVTFISAMCIYSNSLASIDELQAGDKVALPNDATNQGRAIKVLEGAGLIKVDEAAGASPQISDISENELNLQFVEVDAANVPSLLPDVAIGVINANYALDFGFSPANDAIFFDDVAFYDTDDYINVIVARTEDANNEIYQRIVEAYQCEAVEQVYLNDFDGSYVPAWK